MTKKTKKVKKTKAKKSVSKTKKAVANTTASKKAVAKKSTAKKSKTKAKKSKTKAKKAKSKKAKQSPTPKVDPNLPKKIYMIAGEESGDQLGGRLMASLQKQSKKDLEFHGVGGDSMQANGLTSLFDMTQLSVMGLLEILPKLANLLKLRRDVVADIKTVKPDMVITIDSPGFAHKVASRIRPFCKTHNIPHIHYVCPSVWAWKPKRIHRCKKHFDGLLALLPFEPKHFEPVNLPCHYVGHSVVEGQAGKGSGMRFKAKHKIAYNDDLITVLPGSRRGEIARMLPVFKQAVERFAEKHPNIQVVIPTLAHLYDTMVASTQNWTVPVTVVVGDEKFDAFAASKLAIAASGTVSLELALSKCPAVIAYKMSPVTMMVVRRSLLVKYASILNIMADKEIVPELIQTDCTVDNVLARMEDVYQNGRVQIRELTPYVNQLSGDTAGSTPSENAARVVLDYLK